MNMFEEPDTQPVVIPPRPKRDFISIGILIGFIVLGIVGGIVIFNLAYKLVLGMEVVKLPGVAINPQTEEGTPEPGKTKRAPTVEANIFPTPIPWSGGSRVNILLMGLDYRDWEAGETPRTDSMIVFTIDPVSKTAGMLSIPRDMWVTIPGFENAKINTAYFLGESQKLPGGGPVMAAKTVENFIGVPIQFYAQIDFQAFVEFVDEIGGVDIKVKEEMVIDPIGQGNTIFLKPGTQTFDGKTALAYARARHTKNGDFDRATRTQQVLMAIRDNILNYYSLPKLISRAPVLYDKLSAGVRTNITLDQAIQLAWLGKDIDIKSIKNRVIGPQDVTYGKTPDGTQDIIKPVPDKIRIIRDEVFTTGGPIGPYAVSKDTKVLLQADGARISIRNGTQVADLAIRTGQYLQSVGINVVETVAADRVYDISEIYITNGKSHTLKYLAELFQVPTSRIVNQGYKPDEPVDIIVIVGNDWATRNPN